MYSFWALKEWFVISSQYLFPLISHQILVLVVDDNLFGAWVDRILFVWTWASLFLQHDLDIIKRESEEGEKQKQLASDIKRKDIQIVIQRKKINPPPRSGTRPITIFLRDEGLVLELLVFTISAISGATVNTWYTLISVTGDNWYLKRSNKHEKE